MRFPPSKSELAGSNPWFTLGLGVFFLSLSGLSACGDEEKESGGDEVSFIPGDEGADGADGAEGGDEAGTDGGEGGTDAGADEGWDGGGTTGSGSGGDDEVGDDVGTDDGWDGGTDGTTEPDSPDWTPTPSGACVEGGTHVLAALDASGECTSCADGSAYLWMAAAIINECPEPLTLNLRDGVLITTMSMSNADTGEGMGMGTGSGTSLTVELATGESYTEVMGLGGMSSGTWDISAGFYDGASEEIRITIP